MIAAAIEAGRAAYAIYRGDFEVQTKQDESPRHRCGSRGGEDHSRAPGAGRGGHSGRGRRAGRGGKHPPQAATFFLVDPVDGTKEFIQKRGDFTVNIALVRDGVPQLGVVYAPAKSRLFAGDVTKGEAFRSEQSPEDAKQARASRFARVPRLRRTHDRGVTLASLAGDRRLACPGQGR